MTEVIGSDHNSIELSDIDLREMYDNLDETLQTAGEAQAQRSKQAENGIKAWDKLARFVSTLDAERLSKPPEPKEMIARYCPVSATTAIVSGGGIGKTMLTVDLAIESAAEGINTLFVTAEDSPEDYQTKIYNALNSHNSPRRGAAVAGSIKVMNIRGQGLKLITDHGGLWRPSAFSTALRDMVAFTMPEVRFVVFETASRLAGGETNEHFEALVTACDAIAMGINGACAVVHHSGKGNNRDKVVDLYTGRGGSSLGDNTRSFVALTILDDKYPGKERPVIHPDDRGAIFEVLHVRNSYGPTQPTRYFRTVRGDHNGPLLLPVEVASTEEERQKAVKQKADAQYGAKLKRVKAAIKANGGYQTKRWLREHFTDLGMTYREVYPWLENAAEQGDLTIEEESIGNRTVTAVRVS